MVRRKDRRTSAEVREAAMKRFTKGIGPLKKEWQIALLKKAFSDGITLPNILKIVKSRGYKVSEASVRKYVQRGLITGCIRHIGKKGRFQGSYGLYSSEAVHQVIAVKDHLSGDTFTAEYLEGRPSYVGQQKLVGVMEEVVEILGSFDALIDEQQGDGVTVPEELLQLRRNAYDLLRKVHGSAAIAKEALEALFNFNVDTVL